MPKGVYIKTEDHKRKIGLANKGKKRSKQNAAKARIARLGYKTSEETKKKLSETAKKLGIKPPYRVGFKISKEHKQKISEANKRNGNRPPPRYGKDNWNWKGGITPSNVSIRTSLKYKKWREAIFKRDNYTCILCLQKGGKINADHIKPVAYYPELIFELDNGRTLCESCHEKTDTYRGKKMEWKNIIGKGDIARMVKQSRRVDKLFFASGVSNSMETRKEEFMREKNLLLSQDKKRHIVYFSSLGIFLPENKYSLYFQHKKKIEKLIKDSFPRYTIMRLGNITWGNNPNTIINYLHNRIKRGESIEIQDTYRYILSKDELLHWIGKIPDWSCEMNVPGKRMHVRDIVSDLLQYGKVMV